MEAKVYKIENEKQKDSIPVDVDMRDEVVRNRVIQATQDFKTSWRNLAAALYAVWKDKLYNKWGYDDFDQYTAKEVNIRRNTAMKLINSYAFLKKEEPVYAEEDEGVSKKAAPSFEIVNTLQRARKSLDDTDYKKVRTDLLAEGRGLNEVKKDLTQLIRQRKIEADPESERTRSNRMYINKFVSGLSRFKADIETLSILPTSIADDISSLILKIEKYTQTNSE